MPYINGGDVWVDIDVFPIEPTKANPVCLNYSWEVRVKDDGVNWDNHTGDGVLNFPLDRRFTLDLGHFPYSGEYELRFTVEQRGEVPIAHTLVDYDFLRRAELLMNSWWILLSAAIGFLVAKLVG